VTPKTQNEGQTDLSTPLPLDPHPWFRQGARMDSNLKFGPRVGYSQNPADYGLTDLAREAAN
jgi:hypothetical protein